MGPRAQGAAGALVVVAVLAYPALLVKRALFAPTAAAPVVDVFPARRLHRSDVLRERARGVAPGSVVVLGDSIADFWADSPAWARLGAECHGIAGDTTEGVRLRIERGELPRSPRVVVLVVGANDLRRGDRLEDVAARVRGIAASLAPARVVVVDLDGIDRPDGVHPSAAGYEALTDRVLRALGE